MALVRQIFPWFGGCLLFWGIFLLVDTILYSSMLKRTEKMDSLFGSTWQSSQSFISISDLSSNALMFQFEASPWLNLQVPVFTSSWGGGRMNVYSNTQILPSLPLAFSLTDGNLLNRHQVFNSNDSFLVTPRRMPPLKKMSQIEIAEKKQIILSQQAINFAGNKKRNNVDFSVPDRSSEDMFGSLAE